MLFQEGLGDNTALYRDEIEIKINSFLSVCPLHKGITMASPISLLTNVKPSVLRSHAPFCARMSGAWPDIFFFCLIEYLT